VPWLSSPSDEGPDSRARSALSPSPQPRIHSPFSWQWSSPPIGCSQSSPPGVLMTSSPPRVRTVVAAVAVLLMTLALSAQEVPSAAHAQSTAEDGSDETLVVRDAEEPAGPGMSAREIRTLDSDGWVHTNVLTVDLSD